MVDAIAVYDAKLEQNPCIAWQEDVPDIVKGLVATDSVELVC